MAANETQRGSNRLLCDALEAMPELDPSSCLQLASLSIHTTGELLVYCATGPGRTRVAKTAGLQAEQVEDCRIAAELMLVPDMDAHWVPLLPIRASWGKRVSEGQERGRWNTDASLHPEPYLQSEPLL